MFERVLRVHANIYSFVSGVLVSLAANLFTGVYSSDTPPMRTDWLLLIAALWLASSVAWLMVSMEAARVQEILAQGRAKGIAKEGLLTAVGGGARRALLGSLIAAAVLGALGFVLLPFRSWADVAGHLPVCKWAQAVFERIA